MAKRRVIGVQADEFVRAWMTSANIEEVMQKTGMKRSSVGGRAVHYRKLGVNLPKFERGRPTPFSLDIEALNALVTALRPMEAA